MDVKLVLHTAAVAQLVVAPDCDSGCRGFKSHQPPQKASMASLALTESPTSVIAFS